MTKASALPDAPISTGSVTKVKTTAAAKKNRPSHASCSAPKMTPPMISHGPTPEPIWTAGTMVWRTRHPRVALAVLERVPDLVRDDRGGGDRQVALVDAGRPSAMACGS